MRRFRRFGAGPRSRSFSANAKEGAAAAKVGVGGVVEGVPFQNTTLAAGAKSRELAKRGRYIRHAEFDFDLTIRATMN